MLPTYQDPIWRQVVLSKEQYNFDFFALKVLMGRIKMRLEFEKGDDVVDECVDELYKFACQYPDFVEADLTLVRD